MSKSLLDALEGRAWSVSRVMFDLNDILDQEGRPISERRADAAARVGVEMEMRQCPYSGIRHGRWMNVSALNQISRYYNVVLSEITAFRRQVGGENAAWSDVLAAVLDQLARPAIHLLQERDSHGPVPAKVAVGHKLAAGFFGVMRTLHERIALGTIPAVSVEVFLNLVEETNALVGTSEACAGSPQMIRKASTVLVEGRDATDVQLDQTRLDIARCLAVQVQLGIFWELYDRLHLWELIRGDTRRRLVPRNEFLARKLTRAGDDLAATAAPQRPNAQCLPAILDAGIRGRLANALRDVPQPSIIEDGRRVPEQLLTEGAGVIRFEGALAPFATQVACYLSAYEQFVVVLGDLERELRTLLGFPIATPIRLGGAVFPVPQALPWYELILGRRIDESGHLTGSSTGVSVPSGTVHAQITPV